MFYYFLPEKLALFGEQVLDCILFTCLGAILDFKTIDGFMPSNPWLWLNTWWDNQHLSSMLLSCVHSGKRSSGWLLCLLDTCCMNDFCLGKIKFWNPGFVEVEHQNMWFFKSFRTVWFKTTYGGIESDSWCSCRVPMSLLVGSHLMYMYTIESA